MGIFYSFLMTVQVLSAIGIVVLVLLQQGKVLPLIQAKDTIAEDMVMKVALHGILQPT